MRCPPHRPLLAERLPSGRCPPAPAPEPWAFSDSGTLLTPPQAPAWVNTPVFLVCRDCPLKTIPRKELSVSTLRGGLALPASIPSPFPPQMGPPPCLSPQKGCPNSFYHGGPPLLPAVHKSASYLPVYMKPPPPPPHPPHPPARDSAFLPRRPVRPALGK